MSDYLKRPCYRSDLCLKMSDHGSFFDGLGPTSKQSREPTLICDEKFSQNSEAELDQFLT